ncbi:BspA family leucine-rich repeat surface protein [Mycoplasma yeatsii]|uniref:Surface protein n=1 Tax=Mycoplasma yeatsii TaxID=51365 RepID=A0ABU0NFA1_9MOLU|nr:BspA family leucine-rich repeat surface protein [Mycoplasma yeatsii]MDQ0568119.1 surface protein [Mycoplasma yeatsii]
MKKKLLWIITPVLILLALIGTGVGISISKKPNPNTQNRTDEENKKINLSDLTKKFLGTIEEQNLNKENILNKLKELNAEIKDRDLSGLSVEISEFSAVIKSTTKDLKFSGEVEVKFIPVDGNGSNNLRAAVYNEDKSICEKIGYSIDEQGIWRVESFDTNTGKVPEELPLFVTYLISAFEHNFNTIIKGLDKWDTSNVTNMQFMFKDAKKFNQDISHFNTSNVTDMSYMFYQAESFNQPLNNWNTSNVTDMSWMFYNTSNFNQPLNNWNTSNVTKINSMFNEARSFNQNISNWDVSRCERFEDFIGRAPKMTEDLIPEKFRK